MTRTIADQGLRTRTRTAILDAAMEVLSTDPHASLGDIATAAEVGRSTVHRYFPERGDLLRELALHVHALSNAAIERAEPTCGPADAALRRVIEGQFDLGPIVLFVYNNFTFAGDRELMATLDEGDEAVVEVLSRACHQSAKVSAGWPRTVFWALLFAGWEAQAKGTPRHQVVDDIMSTLTSGVFRPETS